MITAGEIYDAVDLAAPFSNALDFDNVGLLVGSRELPVSRVLLTLDITPRVVEEAAALKAELILSHHPVIFHPLRCLKPGEAPWVLARKGIAALCCHTNLDVSPEIGTNIALASRLGLEQVEGAEPSGSGYLLYSGELKEPLHPESFAALVKERLGASQVRYTQGNRMVRRVFLCSGAGGEYVAAAIAMGADAFVTGELKHHEALAAAAGGITAVEAGHYETEKPFGDLLFPYLHKRFPETEFLFSKTEQPPMDSL